MTLLFNEACQIRLKRMLQPSPQGCAKPNPLKYFLIIPSHLHPTSSQLFPPCDPALTNPPTLRAAMTKRKRKSGGAPSNDADSSGPKRARQSTDSSSFVTSQSVSCGRVDPTYGQRSAIPGLDDEEYGAGADGGEEDADLDGGDSDVEYGVDVEALRYLRSVRFVDSFPLLLLLVALSSMC
jgi:hypothetical protein